MIDKKIKATQAKILRLKKALAADKRFWGGEYHDGGGVRYLLPAQYIKIKDYKGGLRYVNWFNKNFPDDTAHAIFLFEWTFILFKCGKLNEAKQKLLLTLESNKFLFDVFLERDLSELTEEEVSSWEFKSLSSAFSYTYNDVEFLEFYYWVKKILKNVVDGEA